MLSAIQRARTFLTPNSSSTNVHKSGLDGDNAVFTTARTTTALFPTVDPAVDGDDCDHDCATCTIEYPKKFSIEEGDKLYGHVKGWHTHMLVATGKSDWVRDVTDEKGSVMQAVGRHGQQLKNGKLMLSASNMPLPADGDGDRNGIGNGDTDGDSGTASAGSGGGAATTVLLLPSWTVVEGVRPGNVPELLDGMVAKGVTNMTPLKNHHRTAETVKPRTRSEHLPDREAVVNGKKEDEEETTAHSLQALSLLADGVQQPQGRSPSQSQDPSPKPTNGTTNINTTTDDPLTLKRTLTFTHAFHTHPSPHIALILLCSQKTRDARCGQSAPLLRREFERHLRPLGLYRDLHDTRPGGVGIYFISHVGGHKYSANVMVYRRKGIERLAGFVGGAAGTGGRGGMESGTSTPMSVSVGVGEEMEEEEEEEERKEEEEGAVQGIWLARVRPADCEGIIKFTVLQGKVVKPQRQLRGGFDRERGVVSW